MKTLKVSILILSLVSFKPAYALEEFSVAKNAIQHLQNNLKGDYLDQVTISILRHAHKYQLDWQIMTAIIAQESSFKQDPQHCSKRRKKCIDYGIAQINYDTWAKEFNLDKKRLTRDIDYNIGIMARILFKLKDEYGPKGSRRHERTWHTRYHSFTRKHRKIYADFIYHRYLRVSSFVKGFVGRSVVTKMELQ